MFDPLPDRDRVPPPMPIPRVRRRNGSRISRFRHIRISEAGRALILLAIGLFGVLYGITGIARHEDANELQFFVMALLSVLAGLNVLVGLSDMLLVTLKGAISYHEKTESNKTDLRSTT